MPGLCGILYHRTSTAGQQTFAAALDSLSYGRCTHAATVATPHARLGCAHLGADAPLYESDHAATLFYGYLARDESLLEDSQHVHDLYLRHGRDSFQHLDGSFAVAICDKRTGDVLLANDRLGLRPLYLTRQKDTLHFASELKALLADPALPRELDPIAVADLLSHGYIHNMRTLLKSVRLLQPGSVLTWQDGRETTRTYWRLTYPDRKRHRPGAEYVKQITKALRSSTARSLRPNLRYGLLLSGGLDSRWLAGLLAEARPDTVAFTFGADDSDDVRIARRVAQTLNLHHRCFPLPANYLADQAEEIVYITDGMYNIVHAQEYPLMANLAQQDVDVLVGGFLGDLLFGRNVNPITVLLPNRQTVINYTGRKLHNEAWRSADLARLLGPDSAAKAITQAREELEKSFSSDEMGALDLRDHQNIVQRHRRFYYAAQCLKTPFINMVHPFIHLDIIQNGVHLPLPQRFMQRAYRHALASAFPSLAAIPWSLTSLPPTSPDWLALIQRALSRTVGKRLPNTFTEPRPLLRVQRRSTDYGNWFRGPLRAFLTDTLLSPDNPLHNIVDPSALDELVAEHLRGQRDLTNGLGILLTLSIWCHQFLHPTLPPPPPGLTPIPK